MKKIIITIDGPAGAGKTTASRALAEKLDYRYLDTGALYRGIAWLSKKMSLSFEDDKGLETMFKDLDLNFIIQDDQQRLLASGEDITEAIRAPEISMRASKISALQIVRTHLLEIQRNMAADKGVVCEGRDMGTVVFPDAEVKFFLDADTNIRAYRRYLELKGTSPQDLAAVEKDMTNRDQNDRTRALAPLVPAVDAIRIDATRLSANEVIETMLQHISEIFGG